MNITAAYVSDLRAASKRPVLVITVDSMPVSTNPTVKRADWTSAKYGPLIEFAATDEHGADWLADELSPAAHFNVAFADGLAPVVDVRVIVRLPNADQDDIVILEGYWALQLRRARSTMKRFDVPYRLVMSDFEGTKGRPAWLPLPLFIECDAELLMGLDTTQACHKKGVDHLMIRGIDYWLCEQHTAAHHAKNFAARHRN